MNWCFLVIKFFIDENKIVIFIIYPLLDEDKSRKKNKIHKNYGSRPWVINVVINFKEMEFKPAVNTSTSSK